MTQKKFFIFLLLQWVILAVLKVWFFNNQIFANAGIQQIIFWLLSAVIAVAIVRRFGVISYLEAIFIIVVWSIGDLLLDILIVGAFTGTGFLYGLQYWVSFLLIALSIFIFHNKRHIQIRKEHLAHHNHSAHASGHDAHGKKH